MNFYLPRPVLPSSSTCINLSLWFLWTCCLIRCPFTPINTSTVSRQNEVIEPARASHAQTWTLTGGSNANFNKLCMPCYFCVIVTDMIQGHKCGHLTNIKTISATSLNLPSSTQVNTDPNVCSSLLIVAGGVGLLYRLGNSNDQWGEWTAPTPSLGVTEA